MHELVYEWIDLENEKKEKQFENKFRKAYPKFSKVASPPGRKLKNRIRQQSKYHSEQNYRTRVHNSPNYFTQQNV